MGGVPWPRRAAAGAALAFAVLSAGCGTVRRWGANAIARAPNRGELAPARTAGEVLVEVGPPSATLSLEIVDPERDPRGTVFLLHGIRADRNQVRGWAGALTGAGFRVVLIDLRGHGRSTGDWLSYGVVESRDLAQALDALERRGLASDPVGVMGLSYGAATAIEWAGTDARVAAVVAVAPFASLRAVVPSYAPLLPESFVESAVDAAGREGGFDPDEASAERAIRRTRAPVLLIHGEEDGRIPPWHSEHILAAGTDHAELILVPGEGHASILGAEVIRERGPAWFTRHLAASSVAEPERGLHEPAQVRVVGDVRAGAGGIP